MKIFILLSLVASISFAAEEKCKARDLTSEELSQINSCLDGVAKSSKRSVKFFYDVSGNLYGVETLKGSAILHSQKGSMKINSDTLSCNTDRGNNVSTLLMSLVFDDEKDQTSKELHRPDSPVLIHFNKCQQMLPHVKCAVSNLNSELQDLMYRLQKVQMQVPSSGWGIGPSTIPANGKSGPGAR